jgi:hypothetical protein
VLGERLQRELEPFGVGVFVRDARADAVSRLGDGLRSEQHGRELADHLAVAQVLGLAREQTSATGEGVDPVHQPLSLGLGKDAGALAGVRLGEEEARRNFRAG